MIQKIQSYILPMLFLLSWEMCLARQIHHHQHNEHPKKQMYQHPENDLEQISDQSLDIIHQIREATRKYHDFSVAGREGFIPFGPDMPNMGEHLVHPGLAVKPELDLLKPSVLTYLRIGEMKVLTGVAYTIPVHPGSLPPELPFEEARWHYHSGNLIEEAHGLHDHTMHEEESDKVRLAMLHAWVWTHNPTGFFEADNWALNYLRLGIEPPDIPDPTVSKALFLPYGGIEYYSRFIELAAKPDSDTMKTIRRYIEASNNEIYKIVLRIKNRGHIIDIEEDELNSLWESMWLDIKSYSGPVIWNHISRYMIAVHNEPSDHKQH